MGRVKTNEKFREEVESLVGKEYIFLEKYIDAKTKIKVKHNKEDCMKVYEVKPTDFLNLNRRCPYCSKTKKKTTQEIKGIIFKEVGTEYSLLSEYINNRTKIKLRHNSKRCNNYEWMANPKDFIYKNSRCPKCYGNLGKKKDTESFKREVYKLTGREYSVLGEYKTSGDLIKMKHNICANEYYIEANSFLRGSRCSVCKGNKKRTTEGVRKEILTLLGSNYIMLDEYKNKRTKLKIKHLDCGNIYYP